MVLVPGYEGIRIGTRVLVPGYEYYESIALEPECNPAFFPRYEEMPGYDGMGIYFINNCV